MAEWILSFPQPHYAVYESGCTGFYPQRVLSSLGINIDVIAMSKLARSTDDKLKKELGRVSRIAILPMQLQ
jgi:hypothetical protein